ncbi:hypothetical protein FRC17_002548 [Serendipita sp. 399]|nr:hypothetical protein FRC17_002548 [Serendipita sp. 399]
MSGITGFKRLISAVKWKDGSSYRTKPFVKVFTEGWLKDFCKTVHVSQGKTLDELGAETAVIQSTFHSGGTNPAAGFHISVRFYNKDGVAILTTNPVTGLPTGTWHLAPPGVTDASSLENVASHFVYDDDE